MANELNKFPYIFSDFINKKDALWDGDPKGDYIMAEHINSLQDAVMAIERYLGINLEPEETVSSILKDLKEGSSLRTLSFHWHKNAPEETVRLHALNQFNYVIFSDLGLSNQALYSQLKTEFIGVVDSQLPLSSFQTQVVEWEQAGARGVFIENFGLIRTRIEQQRYLDFVNERGLLTVIQTDKLAELYNDQRITEYNNAGTPFNFHEDTYVWFPEFGYAEDYFTTDDIYNTIYPQVRNLKSKGLKIIGQAKVTSQQAYSFIQTLAILLSIEGTYAGGAGGNPAPVLYDWHTPALQWRTQDLEVLLVNDRLFRNIPNGSINIENRGIAYIRGNTINSGGIAWNNNTVPGTTIQDRSIPSVKIQDYSAERIVDAINKSSGSVQISLDKIHMEENATLPANIPASNMMTNVILAINRASDPLSTNNLYIESNLLSNIDASMLTGKLKPATYEDTVIATINRMSSNTDSFINVPRIDAGNVNLTGDITGAQTIQGDSISGRIINATEELTTKDSRVTGTHTAHTGDYVFLDADELTARTLSGVVNLEVENLSAGNMNSLVLTSVEAQIDSGVFNQIVTNALTAGTVRADLVTALNLVTDKQITNTALFGEAVIQSSSIINLTANKIISGTIDTGLVTLSSSQGHLEIKDSNIKIYDDLDEYENRNLRLVIGDTSNTGISTIDEEKLGFGLLVLGDDGETRLYDHTGVYNAGLHDNTVSNEKIQEDAVAGPNIQANAIIAKHIQAETITGDKIAADTITAREILSGSITAEEIKAETITGAEIAGETIKGTHLIADIIDTKHLRAGAVKAENLAVGSQVNLIKNGYDSFEQEPLGNIAMTALTGSNLSVQVSNQWSQDGDKSLRLAGPNITNAIALRQANHLIPVNPMHYYIVSAYVKTYAETTANIRLGMQWGDGTTTYGSVYTITGEEPAGRIFARIKPPQDVYMGSVAIRLDAMNTEVYLDAFQVEEASEQVIEPGPWKPTSLTRIDGSSISTGKIDAKFLKIGAGTTFGSGDVITLSDTGITATSSSGTASLNSKGLEITGGAISITGGTGTGQVSLNGNTGLTVQNSQTRTEINADTGFKIHNKLTNQDVLSVDPLTGNLVFSGTARFTSPGQSPITAEDLVRQADRGRQVFTKQPTPPYKEGDLWTQGISGHFMYAIRERQSDQNFSQSDWEMATPYTDDSALKTFVAASDRVTSIHLHMLIHYSSFTVTKLNHLYFVGIERNPDTWEEEVKDVDGFIRENRNSEKVIVPKQALNLEGLSADTHGYLVFNSQDKKISFIYYDKDIGYYDAGGSGTQEPYVIQEGWKAYNLESDYHGDYINLGNNHYIIGELTR